MWLLVTPSGSWQKLQQHRLADKIFYFFLYITYYHILKLTHVKTQIKQVSNIKCSVP